VHVVRRLFCFDQLEPVVQPRVLPKRDSRLSAGLWQPAKGRSYRLCVVRQHARRPPFLLVRGSVRDQSANICARIRASVPYRNRNELLRARRSTYRLLLLRFIASGSSTASSQLAALGCSQRVLGLLLLSISSSWTACSSFLRGPFMQRSSSVLLDRGARLFNADDRLLRQEKARLRIPGKRICSGQIEAARTKLEAGSERKMESACADHHKCVGSKATAGGKLSAWLHGDVSPASVE
jgi:hypothetical protein